MNASVHGIRTGLLLIVLAAGCKQQVRQDLSYDYDVEQAWTVEEFPYRPIVQFKSVFWEPDDTAELRRLITKESIADGRRVLEIGTGTGYLSLLCVANGATHVVATDVNPAAVACARYNAAQQALETNLEVRQVDPNNPGAFTVIKPEERFDLILSNPPWEEGQVEKPADHAFYDPGFALMQSIIDGLPQHLSPGGRCLLSYGNVPAIKRLLEMAEAANLQVKVLDDRKLDELPTNFLPGMLVELRLPNEKVTVEK